MGELQYPLLVDALSIVSNLDDDGTALIVVEEAVLMEFERLTERGGVLGAMERMYQRSKIQEESMYYEQLKHNGELPIVGVNPRWLARILQ